MSGARGTDIGSSPAEREQVLLWLRPQGKERRQYRALTRDKIGLSAMAIADSAGLDALSMRRVAAKLGCGTMSLYRHLRNKDELLDVMIDAAVGEARVSVSPSGDWRADLRGSAHSHRAAMLRHPWVMRIMGRRPAIGPKALAATEARLAALDGLGLSIDEMLRTIGVVNAFVVGYVVNELDEREWRYPLAERASPETHQWASATVPYLRSVAASGRYPRVTRVIIEAEDFPDPDLVFAWQLDRVLDGLAAAILAAQSKSRPGRPLRSSGRLKAPGERSDVGSRSEDTQGHQAD